MLRNAGESPHFLRSLRDLLRDSLRNQWGPSECRSCFAVFGRVLGGERSAAAKPPEQLDSFKKYLKNVRKLILKLFKSPEKMLARFAVDAGDGHRGSAERFRTSGAPLADVSIGRPPSVWASSGCTAQKERAYHVHLSHRESYVRLLRSGCVQTLRFLSSGEFFAASRGCL